MSHAGGCSFHSEFQSAWLAYLLNEGESEAKMTRKAVGSSSEEEKTEQLRSIRGGGR